MTITILRKGWLLITLIMMLLSGCEQSKQTKTSMITTTQNNIQDWGSIANKKVVFAHQSVGNNILNGIERLALRDGAKIEIHEQRSGPAFKGINHFFIGKNGDPKSKIQDFAAAIDAGAAQGADIAMMKLCYVDIESTTDAIQIANDYIANLDTLSKKYPKISFLAITSPLLAIQTGPKAWFKRFIGKQPNGYLDNAKRAEFNTRIRQQYLVKGQLFDLADLESKHKRCTVRLDGKEIEVLCPELTNDSGHLNYAGQELVASNILNLIASK
jgi:hypothetical protein